MALAGKAWRQAAKMLVGSNCVRSVGTTAATMSCSPGAPERAGTP